MTDASSETVTEHQVDASPWASVVRSAGVQVIALGLSTVLGIINTRLIVTHFGKAAFAQFGLLIAIGSLLPFADLGMSAAIINAIGGSAEPRRDNDVRRVLITSIRVLICSGSVIVTVSVVLSALGVWSSILGDGLMQGSGPMAAASCLALIGLALPVSFGERVLTGLGKNHVMIAITALQSPMVFLAIIFLIKAGRTDVGGYLPIIPYFATFVLALVAVLAASRLIRPQIGAAIRAVPRIRTVKGGKVADVAWPMLIQAIALPIAMQSDRIVLSHVSDSDNLAVYNLTAQMFMPIVRVVAVSSAALWPIFARARATRTTSQSSPIPIAAGFAATAALVCAAISLASPWLAEVASGGRITISAPMLAAFSVFIICQAIQYPLGTFLTDAAGLRYQAFFIVLMVPFNLVVSIILAEWYGAIGPVIGSALSALLFQALANLMYVRWRLHR